LWWWVGLLGIGVVVAAPVIWVLVNGAQLDAAIVVQLLGILVPPAILLVGVLWPGRRRPSEVEPDVALTTAADALASTIHEEWVPVVAKRGLRQPAPLAVRWRWSRHPVTGSRQDALGTAPGHQQFEALPNMPVTTADRVESGELGDLFGVYGGLSSGRAVIVGGPGTGKTSAAILMVLEYLRYRQKLPDAERVAVPVPVLLTPQGWDPRYQRLDDWLTDQLRATYRFLGGSRYGTDVAARLVRERQVALFLDGFDELAPALRQAAVQALDEQATFRVVVLTRTDEFADAVGTQHLHGAAVLELQPISAGDAADYVARCQVRPMPPEWQRLVDHLRAQPESPLASALAAPLILSLLRDAFRTPEGVDELLDPARFGTPAEIEAHLVDQVLPVAYTDRLGHPVGRYSLQKARHWLGRIASHMNGQYTRDLVWWRVHQWAPTAVTRILATGLVVAATSGVLLGMANCVAQLAGDGDGIDIGPLGGLGLGLIGGVAAGIGAERREPVARRRVRRRWPPATAPFNPAVGLATGLAVGIAAGFGVSEWVASGPERVAAGLPVGLALGFLSGATAGLSPGTLPRDGRRLRCGVTLRFSVPTMIAAGLPTGLSMGLAHGPASGVPIGLAFGIAFGLLDGFTRGSLSSATPATPRASWQQNRAHARFVGTAFGLTIGAAVAFTVGLRTALTDGFVAGLAIGPVVGAAAGVAAGLAVGLSVSETWRTTLAFLQLWGEGVMPARAMRFLHDAHERGVLRTAGPIYQFRHARLQDQLALQHTR
jgi:hypothetical protein